MVTLLRLSQEKFHLVASIIADPTSHAILQQINLRIATNPSHLSQVLEIARSTVSYHLNRLEAASLVYVQPEGKWHHLVARHDTWHDFVQDLLDLDISRHVKAKIAFAVEI